MELHSPEPDLYAITHGVVGQRPIGRKQRQLRGLLRIFIKGFDHTAPRLVLAVVDLAEIENLALHDLAAGAALALNNAPIAVFFAVLEASVGSQIHRESSLHHHNARKRYLVSTTCDSRKPTLDPTRSFAPYTLKNRLSHAPVEKVGLGRCTRRQMFDARTSPARRSVRLFVG